MLIALISDLIVWTALGGAVLIVALAVWKALLYVGATLSVAKAPPEPLPKPLVCKYCGQPIPMLPYRCGYCGGSNP